MMAGGASGNLLVSFSDLEFLCLASFHIVDSFLDGLQHFGMSRIVILLLHYDCLQFLHQGVIQVALILGKGAKKGSSFT